MRSFSVAASRRRRQPTILKSIPEFLPSSPIRLEATSSDRFATRGARARRSITFRCASVHAQNFQPFIMTRRSRPQSSATIVALPNTRFSVATHSHLCSSAVTGMVSLRDVVAGSNSRCRGSSRRLPPPADAARVRRRGCGCHVRVKPVWTSRSRFPLAPSGWHLRWF